MTNRMEKTALAINISFHQVVSKVSDQFVGELWNKRMIFVCMIISCSYGVQGPPVAITI